MAENELKFKKLSDVELIEEAPDTAHALAEIDGEIKRVAGGVGGGAGGYLVDATGEGALTVDGDVFYVTTPIPGMAEALEKGSTVTIKGDIGIAFGADAATGTYGYMSCSATGNVYDVMSVESDDNEVTEEQIALMKEMYMGYTLFGLIYFLNGHTLDEIMSTAALSTLSTAKMKLAGGNKNAE